jgi:hypothetical protein
VRQRVCEHHCQKHPPLNRSNTWFGFDSWDKESYGSARFLWGFLDQSNEDDHPQYLPCQSTYTVLLGLWTQVFWDAQSFCTKWTLAIHKYESRTWVRSLALMLTSSKHESSPSFCSTLHADAGLTAVAGATKVAGGSPVFGSVPRGLLKSKMWG